MSPLNFGLSDSCREMCVLSRIFFYENAKFGAEKIPVLVKFTGCRKWQHSAPRTVFSSHDAADFIAAV